MAIAQCEFFSNVLGMHMQMNVILPQPNINHIGTESSKKSRMEKYPVLYLLHGMSDDHSIWSRFTSIERYVSGKNLIVVMPNAHRSYYLNMHNGGRYWDYISEELPEVVRGMFHVSERREDTYACGLSMGGYGALRLGLSLPEKFNAVCGISSVADLKTCPNYFKERNDEMIRIFGPPEQLKNSKDDLFYLAGEYVKNLNNKTRFLQICGTEDFLYKDNVRLRNYLKSIELPCTYIEEHGSHTWEFWDRHVRSAIEFFGI